jgi:AAA domain/Toprim-like
LEKHGHTPEDIKESCTLFEGLVGYTTWPWNDDTGALLTIYGKWPGKTPPPGKPKTTALPNPKDAAGKEWLHTKRSPLYLDRALAAGHRDLILVEGVIDAALSQVGGDSRVIACAAAQLSGDQVQTLKRCGVRSVTITLDPDKAGDNGIRSCVRQLQTVGVKHFVAPKLPDGLDPDEFILQRGIDAWKTHVARPMHGYRHCARALLATHGERQPGDDLWLDDLIDKAVAFAGAQPGGSHRDLQLYYWPEIAQATGVAADALAARGKPQEATSASGRTPATPDAPALSVIDSATFAATDYRLEWHVRKLLVKGQPAVVGGPKKCLKTSLPCDLAISMGAGLKVLGCFDAERPQRVGFFSGESGPHAIKTTARNVCTAKGIELADAGVWWGFALPQLSRKDQLQRLAEIIREHGLEAAIFDPLYLCLLAGNSEVKASSMYDMGPLLAEVSSACLAAGATPILCHHNIKRPPDPFAVPELEDLAFAGVAEFTRQWLLVGRRERYEPGTGKHQLWLNVGGSAGFSSCWSVDVDEGVLDDEFKGRKWEVAVSSAADAVANRKSQAEKKREEKQEAKEKAEDAKVLNALDDLTKVANGGPVSCKKVRDRSGFSGEKFGRVKERLLAADLIAVTTEKVEIGKGAAREAEVMRRRKNNEAGG